MLKINFHVEINKWNFLFDYLFCLYRYAKQGKIVEESTTVYHRDRSLSVNETSKPSTLQYNIGIDNNSEVKSYQGKFFLITRNVV